MQKHKNMSELNFSAIEARQSSQHKVLSFSATAAELRQFAVIDRLARDEGGQVTGFQRPQIASHIREIKDYLEKPDSVLPNPIVVAFTSGVTISKEASGITRLAIDVSRGPLGLVVDGQQRLSALYELEGRDFEIFVSALICEDEAELRRQFVLINNTRPLPKSLIYELLPSVSNLPQRLSGRSFAANLTARLNFDSTSSLCGLIRQHTNPSGVIGDTAVQRVIMNSLNNGIMRDLTKHPDGEERSLKLVSEFYLAVQRVFASDWNGHTPKTSRLVHGAGIVALGYVMEVLSLLDGARDWEKFEVGLGCLSGRTAWSGGEWDLGNGDRRHWKAIQNTNRDIVLLAQHLLSIVRADLRRRRSSSDSLPLLQSDRVVAK